MAMNNILEMQTPAQGESQVFKSDYGLESHGLHNLNHVYWNLLPEALYEEIILRREGRITHLGAVAVLSGEHTARAAKDKYIVREPTTEDDVWWAEYNQPFSPDKFNELFVRMQGYLQGKDVFVQDCFAGADPEYQLPVRIITEYAWHSLFSRNMLIHPQTKDEHREYIPEFTLICAPSFKAFPPIDGARSSTVIAINFEQKLCLIADSAYGGEIKKTVFTVMNYILPFKGVMPMHCSASVGKDGETALFFGLSGTGKTTLSADPKRRLIGDDEHGWSERGIFNFEGGCYAKIIKLSQSAEPQIYACTQRFGTILENVVYDPAFRTIDLDDDSITTNTRASYPLEYIDNVMPGKMGGHPKNIIFLACDASGVMPPIARLTPDQAIYHFLSGYTSKTGGTEAGVGDAPEITFSTCFGAPFMVQHPGVYADLLDQKIQRYDVNCWLLNTGWVGGPYGVGERISIGYTRALLNAALSGELLNGEYTTDPVFGFNVPKECSGVPSEILDPASSWPSAESYMQRYRDLALRFIDNFHKFEDACSAGVRNSGPKI